jgi:hypothetical protein
MALQLAHARGDGRFRVFPARTQVGVKALDDWIGTNRGDHKHIQDAPDLGAPSGATRRARARRGSRGPIRRVRRRARRAAFPATGCAHRCFGGSPWASWPAILLGGKHCDQLAAAHYQSFERLGLRVPKRSHLGLDRLAKTRQHLRVERVGLGQLPALAGSFPPLAISSGSPISLTSPSRAASSTRQ